MVKQDKTTRTCLSLGMSLWWLVSFLPESIGGFLTHQAVTVFFISIFFDSPCWVKQSSYICLCKKVHLFLALQSCNNVWYLFLLLVVDLGNNYWLDKRNWIILNLHYFVIFELAKIINFLAIHVLGIVHVAYNSDSCSLE